MVISVAGASTWLSICSQWGIEKICFIAILTLYPQECSILPIFTSRFETAPFDRNRTSLSESFWLQNGGKMDAKSAREVRFSL